MDSISLCMITKNEEFFLEQCLNSIKNLADEIIIVDTGSTDKTKEIARKFTDKIFDFEWEDDFSKARNVSLRYATKDWILVLDADESISQKDHQRIKEMIKNKPAAGFSFIHRNYNNESNASGWVSSRDDFYSESKVSEGWYPNPITRLFKNNKNIFYTGVVHEDVYDSAAKQGEILQTDIPIHHYGKLDKEKLMEKNIFYEKLGEKKIEQQGDFYSFYELGKQYLHNKKLNQSIDIFKRSIELNGDYSGSWFMLGTAYLLKGDLNNALIKLKRAKALNPNYSPVYENTGIIFSKKKEFNKAIKNFTKAIHLNPFSASSYRNLGLCYKEIGDEENAYIALKKAVELNPKYGDSIKFR